MSNLSDIGFPTKNNEEINQLVDNLLKRVEEIKCPQGSYLKFADESGAEFYFQMNGIGELLGFNPYFNGKSKRTVFITMAIGREYSELDGAFYASANATEPDGGNHPFVFDLPDFHTNKIELPKACEIQLNAFASNDFQIYESEEDYSKEQNPEMKPAAQSFVSSGLFDINETGEEKIADSPPAHAALTGIIKEFELKTNQTSGEKFYWFLVETSGGEIDVIADARLIASEPKIGGIVQGGFWLTGRVLRTLND